MGQKVNVVHGYTYQNYHSGQKYHSVLAFIVKLAWVNKTKNFESVLKRWHLTFYAASAITNISPEMFECGSNLRKNSLWGISNISGLVISHY